MWSEGLARVWSAREGGAGGCGQQERVGVVAREGINRSISPFVQLPLSDKHSIVVARFDRGSLKMSP